MVLSVGPHAPGRGLKGAALYLHVVRGVAHSDSGVAAVPEASSRLRGDAPPRDDLGLFRRRRLKRDQRKVVPACLVLEANANAKVGPICHIDKNDVCGDARLPLNSNYC